MQIQTKVSVAKYSLRRSDFRTKTTQSHTLIAISNARCNALYYNSTFSSASCSKELYKITNNILARTKQVHPSTMYTMYSLPELFSNYFSGKIMRLEFRPILPAVTVTPLALLALWLAFPAVTPQHSYDALRPMARLHAHRSLKPGVHTNDFAPIHGRRARIHTAPEEDNTQVLCEYGRGDRESGRNR